MTKIIQFPAVIANLRGNWNTKEVWLNGRKLSIKKSQKIWLHSHDYNWSYGGSGPAQLALAVLLENHTVEEALNRYQQFKRDVIAALPSTDFDVRIDLSNNKVYLS